MQLEDIEAHILSALRHCTDAVAISHLQAARLGLQAFMAKRVESPANQPAAAPADALELTDEQIGKAIDEWYFHAADPVKKKIALFVKDLLKGANRG